MENGFYEHPMMPHGMPDFNQCPPYFLQMMHFYHLKMMEYYQMNKMNEGMKSMGFPSSIFPPLEGKSPNCSHKKAPTGQGQQHQSGCQESKQFPGNFFPMMFPGLQSMSKNGFGQETYGSSYMGGKGFESSFTSPIQRKGCENAMSGIRPFNLSGKRSPMV